MNLNRYNRVCWLGVVFVIALLVRCGLLVGWYTVGNGGHFSDDTPSYYELGANLAAGSGFLIENRPSMRRVPIYPVVISIFIKSGFFPLGLQIFQAVVGALSCLLLFLLAEFLFNRKVAIVASLWMALDYAVAKECVYLLPETIFLCLFMTSTYFLLRAGETRIGLRYCAFAGIFAAVTVLTKEVQGLYFLCAAAFYAYVRIPGKLMWRCFVIFIAIYFLVLSPWVIRNSRLNHRLTFLSNTSGLTFYLGNNSSIQPRLYGGEWRRDEDTAYPDADNVPPGLSAGQLNTFLFQKAVEFIKVNPIFFIKNSLYKVARLYYPFYSESPLWSRWLMGGQFVLIAVFGFWGVILSRGDWRKLSVILLLFCYVTGIHAVTIPTIRYRYVLMPFMIMFASLGFLRGCDVLKSQALKNVKTGNAAVND